MKNLFLLFFFVSFSAAFGASVSRIAVANGNWTAAATWAVVEQSANAELDSEAANTLLTTTPVYSSTFTPGAITVDGVAVKLAGITNSPTGTLTVTLRNSTLSSDVISVTINVIDIPTTDMRGQVTNNPTTGLIYPHGWLLVTFAPQVLAGATDYTIGLSTSTANQIFAYRNATAGNWSRMLRTTTTGAPLTTDKLIIAGEHTGAGAVTSRTVTMNNTTATTFGQVVSATFCQSIVVCDSGSLLWSVDASVTNTLTVAGLFLIGEGGTVTMGTAASPTPATSVNQLNFDCTVTGDSYIQNHNGGTFSTYGAALPQTWCWLYAPVAAGTTVTNFTLLPRGAATTGWGATDRLIFGASSNVYFQVDHRTNTAWASVTNGSLSPGAGFTYAHPSTNSGGVLCPVGNLTRNVQISGESIVLMGYIVSEYSSTNSFYFTELKYLGHGGNHREASISCYVGRSGTMLVNSCAFWYATGYLVYVDIPLVGSSEVNIVSNVFWSIGAGSPCVYFGQNNPGGSGTGSGTRVADNLMVGAAANTAPCLRFESFYNLMGNFLTATNNTMCSALGYGIKVNGFMEGLNLDDNTIHSCSWFGILLSAYSTTNISIRNMKLARNGGIAGGGAGAYITSGNWNFSGWTVFGNGNSGIAVQNVQQLTLTNCNISGETGYAQAGGLSFGFPSMTLVSSAIQGVFGNSSGDITILNSTFGSPVAHTVSDIYNFTNFMDCTIKAYNTVFASTTEVVLSSNGYNLWVGSEKHDGVTGSNKFWALGGDGIIDITIFNAASPSLRVSPTSASQKFSMPLRYCVRVPVTSSATRAVGVYIRKSVSGDGSAYNGNQPRLIARAEYPLGVTSDTVIDTASVAAGNWEQLTGTTPSVSENGTLLLYVDLDGTAGWINVDDWSVSPLNSLSVDYWHDGFPMISAGNSAGGGSSAVFVQ